MRICHLCGGHSDAPYDIDPEAIRQVVDATAARTGLTAAAVMAGRSRPAVRARAVAVAVLRRRLGLSYLQLAAIFDRDSKTMQHAHAVHNADLSDRIVADLEATE